MTVVSDRTPQDAWEEEVLATWGLDAPPFSELAADTYFFPGEQYLRALDFMRRVLCSRVSAGVLTGERGVGKSVLVRSFITGLDDRILVAHVQRTDMAPRQFLLEVLRQFGVELDQNDRTDGRLLLERYITHQVSNGRICLLIVENAQGMQPLVLEELRHIASWEADGMRLVKLLLLGQPLLNHVVDSPRLVRLVPTGVPRVCIAPLSEDQLSAYVAHRLRVAGSKDPDRLLPHTLMPLLHRLSRGVPAMVNRLCERSLAVAVVEGQNTVSAQSVLSAAMQMGMDVTFDQPATVNEEQCPPDADEVLLLVSVSGGTDSVVGMNHDRMLIGRSELADVRIDSAFVSRYHALIVREPGQDLLIDLGSTNGVLVNSRRVVRHVLQHRDLIQIGPARISYLNPARAPAVPLDSSETMSFARSGAANGEHAVFAFGRFDDAG
ncbi:MAG: AAA family ATPase [Steroidobacteraceae bacterium]